MKSVKSNQPSSRKIYVEYSGDRYNEAINAAIAGSGLEAEQVTVIAIQHGLKLGRNIDR